MSLRGARSTNGEKKKNTSPRDVANFNILRFYLRRSLPSMNVATPEYHAYYLDRLGIQRWELQNTDLHTSSVETPRGASSTWDELQQQVTNCQRCSLAKTRTQTVFGAGNVDADLLIVGEAPGFYEDQQGEPFVGMAGQLLTAMLKAINLERQAVYIANVLKCRPPNNRDPLPGEVQQCTAYLESQVALIKPKLILALGRHAAHYLLDTNISLSQLRAGTHSFRNTAIPLIATYHPAYLLRNPKDKQNAYMDLLKVKSLLLEFSQIS